MTLKLNNFKDTEYVQYEDECRKIENWYFVSDQYCMRGGDCESVLVLEFEDGTCVKSKNVKSLNNC